MPSAGDRDPRESLPHREAEPTAGRIAFIESAVDATRSTGRPAGFHASKCSRVRSIPLGDHMPDSSIGRGRGTGFGRMTDGGMVENGPS